MPASALFLKPQQIIDGLARHTSQLFQDIRRNRRASDISVVRFERDAQLVAHIGFRHLQSAALGLNVYSVQKKTPPIFLNPHSVDYPKYKPRFVDCQELIPQFGDFFIDIFFALYYDLD